MTDETVQATAAAETATVAATEAVGTALGSASTDVAHDAERVTKSHLHKLLAWLKAEFEAIGIDIKAEIDKL